MKYYVYIVVGRDGKFYTGYTNNLRRRINQHNGVGFWPGAKFTESCRPIFLAHFERFPNRREAKDREREIKSLGHSEKQDLIDQTTKEDILGAV
jgi:putative endonuclease